MQRLPLVAEELKNHTADDACGNDNNRRNEQRGGDFSHSHAAVGTERHPADGEHEQRRAE